MENSLMALEESCSNLSCLVNALGLMALGLMQARDPYANGINALWACLVDADREIQQRLSACRTAT